MSSEADRSGGIAPVSLFTADQIQQRVDELAQEIVATGLSTDPPLLLVSILRGAFVFTADLVRALNIHGLDGEVDFLGLSSYGDGTVSQGRVRLTRDLDTDVSGRCVLVVDDILDSGRTLSFVKTLLASRGATEIKCCVLLDKPSRRKVAVEADFKGFTVSDAFVVGYGMDVAGLGRGLPYIGTMPET